ncbi:hypothetical protein ACP4OV_011888 [Aristida adscensionis]
MAASILRSVVGRAVRRAPSWDGFLTLLRGPRPDPAAPPSAEVYLLAKKVDDVGKKDQFMELAESFVQEQKKHGPAAQTGSESLLFPAMLSAAMFSVACDMGHEHGTRMYEASNLKNAATS